MKTITQKIGSFALGLALVHCKPQSQESVSRNFSSEEKKQKKTLQTGLPINKETVFSSTREIDTTGLPLSALNNIYLDHMIQFEEQKKNITRLDYINKKLCNKLEQKLRECLLSFPIIQTANNFTTCQIKDGSPHLTYASKSRSASFFTTVNITGDGIESPQPKAKYYFKVNNAYVSSTFPKQANQFKIWFYRKNEKPKSTQVETAKYDAIKVK